MVLRLLHYWRDIGSDESLPARSDIDPEAVGDMWPDCAILEVADAEGEPRILYLGTALKEDCGTDPTGAPLSEIPAATLAGEGFSYFRQVFEKKVPITYGGEYTNRRGNEILYRSIVLPLAEDGKTIDGFLCAANCREIVTD